MPASASLIAAIVRLGGGALDLYMYVAATEEDGICPLTSEQIADALGCDKRSVERKAHVLRQHGYLKGGSGMWKTLVPQSQEITGTATDKTVAATTNLSHLSDESVAPTTILSQPEPASPPPTPPTPVRESVALVVRDDVDVTDETNDASPPHTAPPASPGRRTRAATDYTPEFQAVWRAYPHFNGRSNKPKSFAKWRSLSPDEQATVERNLPAWQASHDWTRDGGQFVPAMERWLEGERWRASPKPATAARLEPEPAPPAKPATYVLDLTPERPPLESFPGETMEERWRNRRDAMRRGA